MTGITAIRLVVAEPGAVAHRMDFGPSRLSVQVEGGPMVDLTKPLD